VDEDLSDRILKVFWQFQIAKQMKLSHKHTREFGQKETFEEIYSSGW
jgi:hypothetical protein